MKSWKMSFVATAVYDELEYTEEEVNNYINEYTPELRDLPFEEKVVSYVKQKLHYTNISYRDAISELIEDMYWGDCPSFDMYDYEVDCYEEYEDDEEESEEEEEE